MNQQNGFSLSSIISICIIFVLVVAFSSSLLAQASSISSVVVTTANANPTGNCPVKVDFTGRIKSEGPTTVSYQFVRSDGSTGPVESLVFNSAGEKTIPYDWSIGGGGLRSFDGWVKLRVITPRRIESQTAAFAMRCTAGPVSPQIGIQAQTGNAKNNIGTLFNPNSGEFRIFLIGFTCNHPTEDKRLEEDGAGDEVFLRTDVMFFDGMRRDANFNGAFTANATVQPFHQTKEIGDTSGEHSYRIRGGSASNIFGGNGGFKAGDSFPTATPWTVRGLGTPLPFLVWQGTLASGMSGIAVMPSIWEADDNPILLGRDYWWPGFVSGALGNINRPVAEYINDKFPTIRPVPSDVVSRVTNANFLYEGGDISNLDRPIGVRRFQGGVRAFSYAYNPTIVVLTYEAASNIAANIVPPETRSRGVFTVRKVDESMGGDYTLYFFVERINR
jgi:hypothetical protein